jgi:sugar-specific transcriptional regulator TrmB
MVLATLGLSSEEEALYRTLVEFPSASVERLSQALTLPPAEVERLLAALSVQGLVARTGSAPEARFVASSPAVALGPLVRQRREDLRRAELELAALTERFWVSASDRTAGDLVEVITGVELVAKRFAQLQRGAEKEVRALVTAQVLAVARRDNPDEDEGVQRGVHYQVVIERAIFEQQGADDDMAGAVRAGEDVRVVEKVPIKMLIADQNMAMVPMDSTGHAPAALLVHRSGLLDALIALFDSVWAKARPLRLEATGLTENGSVQALAEMDRQILILLLAGLTDASISTQLGLSMRTVQRRVREMMDQAGVHTRLQLGWHAARSGWA